MKYTKLDTNQQEQMLDQRLTQYEQEHYNHQVNLDLLVATGATDEGTQRAMEDAQNAMETLDKAHAETTKKLEELRAPKAAKGKKS